MCCARLGGFADQDQAALHISLPPRAARKSPNCDDHDPTRFQKYGEAPIPASEIADADHRICAESAVEAIAMPTRITARPIALRADIGSRNKIIPPRLTIKKTKPTITG
jgi:hypothetical protein